MRDLKTVGWHPTRVRHLSGLMVLCLALLIGLPAQAGTLSDATRPYLLLHADDAIDWHPWGPDALELARREDRPIFLSIGYAACHWCHVLARTTFADDRVIDSLNRHFVGILVDREERPDLDGHFMAVMLAMYGRTGSPANFILTPDLVPLFAAGYLAPDAEYGEPGLVESLRTIVFAWTDDRESVRRDAEGIRTKLRSLAEPVEAGLTRGRHEPRDAAARAWVGAFDRIYGGFGGEPKFPFPNVLSFLLQYGVWNRDQTIKAHVYKTLDAMAAGGVRDQLGGAFHRYAVDRAWRLPHFEIMLAENALLARLYLEAYQASHEPRYALVAREILDDLLARFRLSDGGFASSLDAETEQIDGLFYTWTADQVTAALGAEASRYIAAYLESPHGVLRLLEAPESLVETQRRLAESRARLRTFRAQRVAPFRDEKLVTSWNALAISAFAIAAQVLDDARYLRVAHDEMDRLLQAFGEYRNLRHSTYGGRATDQVFVDDYAFLAQAMVDLYETDFRQSRLDQALQIMEILLQRFQTETGKSFQFIPIDSAAPIGTRVVLNEDGMPSGNAAALLTLRRLVLYGAAAAIEEDARAIQLGLGRYLDTQSATATGLLRALDFQADEAHEIVIVGALGDKATQALLRQVRDTLLHGTVLAAIPPDGPTINENWPLLSARPMLDGKPTAYVCRKRLCDWPVNTAADLATQLEKLVHKPPSSDTAR